MNIRDWVFDLDNTLYPAPALYDLIGARMTAYIARVVGVDTDVALDLCERYFHRYGATMVGLVRHHDIDAHDFLAHVHDVDCSILAPDPELGTLIAALPGRKFVFTNGGGGHGQRVLARLGIADVFDAVFDLEAAGLVPKPQPQAYANLIAAHAIDPTRALLIEDTPGNLIPAHALGFATALVSAARPEPLPGYVHHWGGDVKTLLRNGLQAGAALSCC
jgi:putative hydrolase of the HAD superfamily